LVPYFILPQSIGPFDFKLGYKFILFPLIWLYLRYPLKIFVREKAGIASLNKFAFENIEKSRDIVLQKSSYNLANIYRKVSHSRPVALRKPAVGLVFNKHVFNRADNKNLYLLYQKAVDKLIAQNKNIYMLVHSTEDVVLFDRFIQIYQENKQIEFLRTNYNAIEIENIIRQFDFMITSRYHSIIHAYKNGVPAIVLGWSEKYIELLKDFGQIEYLFDIHNNFDEENFLFVVNKMLNNHKLEKEKIKYKFLSLEQMDVFEKVDQSLKNNK
jgi:colanic acid/amylovoran biosynthesis protein